MPITAEKINKILTNKNLNPYSLSKLTKMDDGYVINVIKGKKPFSDCFIKKLLPILEVARAEFDSWLLADSYNKNILELAIKHKSETKKQKGELILKIKIDSILKQKNMSRTALSKQIKYCQSSLNKMITGQLGLSKSVRKEIAPILEVTEEEILSWIVADKYSLKVIRLAINHLIV